MNIVGFGVWCKRKLLSDADRMLPANMRYYRSMTNPQDAALFNVLEPIVQPFVTVARLKEVAHGMDTQVNESFNNTFSWLAPKNKVYCGSQSLRNRLLIGIGINALGLHDYFMRLYKELGIVMTPNVQHFLATKELKRAKRIQKVKLIESKKQRRLDKHAKQRKDEVLATIERQKREGTYKPAQNLEDITKDDPTEAAVTGSRKKPAARICPHCG
jgi:hypothetical protein